jgi:16S rRNA (uracil1498-N3)-methyltransferase
MASIFRCFVPEASSFQSGQAYSLPNDEVHHLLRVLRAKAGSEIHLLSGKGHVVIASLEIHQRQAWARVEKNLPVPPPSCNITVAPGLLKKNAMNLLFREATALGAHCIVPIITQRSEIKIPSHQISQKMEHWRSILIAACKQSGQAFLPQMEVPQGLETYLAQPVVESHIFLVASLSAKTKPLWPTLEAITARQNISSLSLFIGPEGDFTPEEYQFLSARGAYSIQLSRQILRSETASFYALSVLDQWMQNYEVRSR